MREACPQLKQWRFRAAIAFLLLAVASSSTAAWLVPDCPFRRPITVTWDAEHASGREMASFDFYTDGQSRPDASDLRLATGDGRLLPLRVLQSGPGDRVRVLFTLQKNVKDYDLYFGSATAGRAQQELPITAGLLMSMRVWNNAGSGNFNAIERSFERSGPQIGQVMIPDLFLGFNPLGEQTQTISKTTGTLFAPGDGRYLLAMSVDHAAALFIDGQPLLFASAGPGDIRYHATTTLTRGPHDLVFYHVANSEWGRFTVGWQTPESGKVQVIGRQAFGTCFGAEVGLLQPRDKPLTADFSTADVGMVPVGLDNVFLLHFHCPAHGVSRTTYHWDFGDGQSADGDDADHVFFVAGVYTVRLTVHIGANAETETRRLVVGPNYQHPLNPPMADEKVAAAIAARYDAAALRPTDAAGIAARLLLQCGSVDGAAVFAEQLAGQRHQTDVHAAGESISAVVTALASAGQFDRACALWSHTPADSNLQPHAAKQAAQIALWSEGEFDQAVTLLRPFIDRGDPAVRRLYGQALLLSGKVAEARAVLSKLPNQDAAGRESVLSGAFARSIDFYILRNEPDAGEEAWDRWQAKYPATFLDGYAAVERARLIALRDRTAVAAKVAEAFATAVPNSSYAPRLLDMAARWLGPIDPAHGDALRNRLKKDYPEDPLSQ